MTKTKLRFALRASVVLCVLYDLGVFAATNFTIPSDWRTLAVFNFLLVIVVFLVVRYDDDIR